MKVRFVIPAYRDRYGADHVRGDEWEYADHVAVKLVRLGYAEPVRSHPPEVVVPPAPKTTAKMTGKSKARKEVV